MSCCIGYVEYVDYFVVIQVCNGAPAWVSRVLAESQGHVGNVFYVNTASARYELFQEMLVPFCSWKILETVLDILV
jgi:hypothetical protein